jgi:hypothetical protein
MQDADLWDVRFFGISQGEAVQTDPQQRMLMVRDFTVVTQGGETLAMVRGCYRSVLMGISSSEYAGLLPRTGAPIVALHILAVILKCQLWEAFIHIQLPRPQCQQLVWQVTSVSTWSDTPQCRWLYVRTRETCPLVAGTMSSVTARVHFTGVEYLASRSAVSGGCVASQCSHLLEVIQYAVALSVLEVHLSSLDTMYADCTPVGCKGLLVSKSAEQGILRTASLEFPMMRMVALYSND